MGRLLELLAGIQKEGAVKKPALPPPPGLPSHPTTWRIPQAESRQNELQLWQKWKQGGERPEDMEPLLNSLQPLIHRRVRQFAGKVPVRSEAIRAEANRKTIEGLRKFDPSRSQMNTYLTHELQGISRFVRQNQNLSRITEDRANRIGDFQRAKAIVWDRVDREPTTQEIADEMKVDRNTVMLLEQELRRDLVASSTAAAQLDEDPFEDETPADRQLLKLIRFELTPQELLVFEYLTGDGGKPQLKSTGAIARKLGWPDSRVSQHKTAIAKKIRRYRT